ncbi:MAG: gliding motility-associated ABC transporter ATP-binding subunit GldA [Bacteroidetes bacterium GWF2_29_10]|nr:MAG: gliding motility-associated ABC transporter ATP-binding subunit GldA [Bacteroidetes bacterium GWF2_29_10]
MTIEATNLTKLYSTQKALDNVSFKINSNEIVGLIGPNGAGKSTLMKIITCFIPQTEGEVRVCGYDVTENSIEVRRNIGYLPENNPLYLDMYVREYLMFIGNIYKVKNTENAVNDIIGLIGLEVEKNKKIGALSKGYKQRVGLAQSMIHNPKILILDEPTSGLDPNQIIEIRNLIVKIGKQKTVLLSTHNMHEVETVCDKILLINKGKLVANTKTANLDVNSLISTIIVEFDKELDITTLKTIEGITEVIAIKKNTYKIVAGKEDIRSEIFDFAVKNNLKVLSLNMEKQDLESVFHNLTK